MRTTAKGRFLQYANQKTGTIYPSGPMERVHLHLPSPLAQYLMAVARQRHITRAKLAREILEAWAEKRMEKELAPVVQQPIVKRTDDFV